MRRALGVAVSVVMLTACRDPRKEAEFRQVTQSYRFAISADSLPPFANEPVAYHVTVIDRLTGQPVQSGEGQIYGQLVQGSPPRTWDSFTYGPAVGTYHANVRFALGGTWSMGMRFRRDSLSPLEVTNWVQQVKPERDIKATP